LGSQGLDAIAQDQRKRFDGNFEWEERLADQFLSTRRGGFRP
jgi:hypothetical protein